MINWWLVFDAFPRSSGGALTQPSSWAKAEVSLSWPLHVTCSICQLDAKPFSRLFVVKSESVELRDGRPRKTDRRYRRWGHVHRLPARRDRWAQQEPQTEFLGGGEGHEHHGDRRDLQVRTFIKSTRAFIVPWGLRSKICLFKVCVETRTMMKT